METIEEQINELETAMNGIRNALKLGEAKLADLREKKAEQDTESLVGCVNGSKLAAKYFPDSEDGKTACISSDGIYQAHVASSCGGQGHFIRAAVASVIDLAVKNEREACAKIPEGRSFPSMAEAIRARK